MTFETYLCIDSPNRPEIIKEVVDVICWSIKKSLDSHTYFLTSGAMVWGFEGDDIGIELWWRVC